MALTVEPSSAPSLGVLTDVDNDHVRRTQIVRAALELDVIPAVAAGNHDPDAIARATGCSIGGMRVLLDGLCAVKLLHWSDGAYALTPTAEAYLDPGSPAYCAEVFLDDLRAWDRFTDTVRTGIVPRDYASAGSDRVWAAWAAHQLRNWPNDLPTYRERWQGLGVTAASMPDARVLDVGCGAALATLALALDLPGATLTGIDREAVIEVAARLAATLDVGSRASFIAGDVASLQALSGSYDIVFSGHVFKFLDPDQIVAALRHGRRLLAPGGRLVISEFLANPGDYDDADPALVAAWVFNIAPRGRIYTLAEYGAMLGDAGFGPARRLDGTLWFQAEAAG
jgi:2-polyprenyl-3-methyl-5-hydroxy-6-metoxy-1,4-benzoquinol methylase